MDDDFKHSTKLGTNWLKNIRAITLIHIEDCEGRSEKLCLSKTACKSDSDRPVLSGTARQNGFVLL